MLKLYGDRESGNCYKARLLLAHLGTPYRWIDVDVLKGESRSAEFLAKNPNGKIPLLEIEEDVFLAESNAILYYLAQGTDFLPDTSLDRARVLQWMFFEQYSHEPFIATSRFWIHYLDGRETHRDELEKRREPGYKALDVMEQHLSRVSFFAGGRLSIADLALYAYTHVADEGDFDLGPYPAIRAWLDRVAALPGHTPLRD